MFTSACVYYIGTVMGNTYGIAKKATAIAVKVLSDFGSGSTAYVVYRTSCIVVVMIVVKPHYNQ